MNRRIANLNRIISIVREKGEVDVYFLSAFLGLSPATVFQYCKLVPYYARDIVYENGKLRRAEDETGE